MGNRRLYGEKEFFVRKVIDYDEDYEHVWHLEGVFSEGSLKKYKREYRIRVQPDLRWRAVHSIKFIADRVYEAESVGYFSRRRVYGSGQWYISPYRSPNLDYTTVSGEFTFSDFEVTPISTEKLAVVETLERQRLAAKEAARRQEAISLGLPQTATQQEIWKAQDEKIMAKQQLGVS